jgi:hypothetical protein
MPLFFTGNYRFQIILFPDTVIPAPETRFKGVFGTSVVLRLAREKPEEV